jgi:hypothetical protein
MGFSEPFEKLKDNSDNLMSASFNSSFDQNSETDDKDLLSIESEDSLLVQSFDDSPK